MRIFADSACDLPKSFFEENDVTLLPLHVLIDDNDYEDLVTIEAKEVYEAIRNGKHPKTSQVSPELFLKKWKELAEIWGRWTFTSLFLPSYRELITPRL